MSTLRNDGAKVLDICLVEDEADLREEMVEALTEEGFDVRGFPGSRELYAGLLTNLCDIAILDIGLPGEDGFAIAERLHLLKKNIGIIMLTARSHTDDRIRALQGGADAFVQKPVALQELTAVIHSVARRLHRPGERDLAAAPSPTMSWTLADDGWVLNGLPDISLHLSAQERAFLQCLWQQMGEVVSRESLVQVLADDPEQYDYHRLDMLVSRLRRKLAALGATLPLRSVRGQGYVVVATSERIDG